MFSFKAIPIRNISGYPRNARTHSHEQIAQLCASITQFGFTNPLLVDEADTLIAGHGRLLAAQKLGMGELPAIVVTGLSDAQKAALRLADNKLAMNAGWDDALLRSELGDLRDVGFDLSLTGFADDELGAIFADQTVGLTDPDDVPEVQAEAVSVLGDVWLLGRHRLVCGDATSEADVALALGGVKPHLMVTDPPYGVDYDPEWRLNAGLNKEHQTRAEGRVTNDKRADWSEAWLLSPSDVAYIWHGALHASEVAASLVAAGFDIRSQIIWAKPSLVIGRGHYHWQHEPCWYAARKTAHWMGDRKQSTLWDIPNMHRTQGNVDDGHTSHSTQKPVECMRRPIENNSSPGQAVYDPFVGSGTTIIAAEMTGRAAHCIEISPTYCDVTIQRWQNFTGQTATKPDGTPHVPLS